MTGFDIWPDFSPDTIQKDSVVLRRRYRKYLKDGGEMLSWTQKVVRPAPRKKPVLGAAGVREGLDHPTAREHPSDSGA